MGNSYSGNSGDDQFTESPRRDNEHNALDEDDDVASTAAVSESPSQRRRIKDLFHEEFGRAREHNRLQSINEESDGGDDNLMDIDDSVHNRNLMDVGVDYLQPVYTQEDAQSFCTARDEEVGGNDAEDYTPPDPMDFADVLAASPLSLGGDSGRAVLAVEAEGPPRLEHYRGGERGVEAEEDLRGEEDMDEEMTSLISRGGRGQVDPAGISVEEEEVTMTMEEAEGTSIVPSADGDVSNQGCRGWDLTPTKVRNEERTDYSSHPHGESGGDGEEEKDDGGGKSPYRGGTDEDLDVNMEDVTDPPAATDTASGATRKVSIPGRDVMSVTNASSPPVSRFTAGRSSLPTGASAQLLSPGGHSIGADSAVGRMIVDALFPGVYEAYSSVPYGKACVFRKDENRSTTVVFDEMVNYDRTADEVVDNVFYVVVSDFEEDVFVVFHCALLSETRVEIIGFYGHDSTSLLDDYSTSLDFASLCENIHKVGKVEMKHYGLLKEELDARLLPMMYRWMDVGELVYETMEKYSENHNEEEQRDYPDTCGAHIASLPFDDKIQLLSNCMRNNHSDWDGLIWEDEERESLYLSLGQVVVVRDGEHKSLYIGVVPGKFSDISNLRDSMRPRLDDDRVRVYFPVGKQSIMNRAWTEMTRQLQAKVNEMTTIPDFDKKVDMLVEIARGDDIQKMLQEKQESVEGMNVIGPDDVTLPLWHLLRYQTTKRNETNETNLDSICLCLHPNCGEVRKNSNTSAYAVIVDENCVDRHLNVTHSSAGSPSLYMSKINNLFTGEKERKYQSELITETDAVRLKAKISPLVINTAVQEEMLSAVEAISERVREKYEKEKVRYANDPEAKRRSLNKSNARRSIKGGAVRHHPDDVDELQPGLSDDMYFAARDKALDWFLPIYEKSLEDGVGVLAYLSDCKRNCHNKPTDNEHLRWVINDKNSMIRRGARYKGALLEYHQVGGIEDEYGEDGIVLIVEYIGLFCYGGKQSGALEKRLTEFFVEEFPGVFANQRYGGLYVVKANSMATLTVVHFGQGARGGELALNKNSGKERPNPTLVRLKKHMPFSDEEFVLVVEGEEKEHFDP